MPCEFEEDIFKTFPGLTLFSKGNTCLKPTAVYLPRKSLSAKKKPDAARPPDTKKSPPVNFPVIAYEFAANRNCSESLAASVGNQKRFHW